MRELGITFCFATSYNSPKKHDGDEFMREMRLFNQCYESTYACEVRLKKPSFSNGTLREQFVHGLIGKGDFQTIVFFMHGSWRSLYGIDHNIWTTDTIAKVFKIYCEKKKPLNIVLYACGCGGGKGKWKNIHEYRLGSRWDMRGEFGFAMRLAHDLSDAGIHDYRIFAHVGSGHVTERPFCVWITEEDRVKSDTPKRALIALNDKDFQNLAIEKTIVRREIVPYRSWASLDRKGRRQWLRWVKYLQETKDGRFRAPFLTDAELAEVIGE